MASKARNHWITNQIKRLIPYNMASRRPLDIVSALWKHLAKATNIIAGVTGANVRYLTRAQCVIRDPSCDNINIFGRVFRQSSLNLINFRPSLSIYGDIRNLFIFHSTSFLVHNYSCEINTRSSWIELQIKSSSLVNALLFGTFEILRKSMIRLLCRN